MTVSSDPPLATRIANAEHGATLGVHPWQANPAHALAGQYNRHDLTIVHLDGDDPGEFDESMRRVKQILKTERNTDAPSEDQA